MVKTEWRIAIIKFLMFLENVSVVLVPITQFIFAFPKYMCDNSVCATKFVNMYIYIYIYKGKVIPLQAWCGPGGG